LNKISENTEEVHLKDNLTWKDKILIIWVVICFVGNLIILVVVLTLIFIFVINSKDSVFEAGFVFLKENSLKINTTTSSSDFVAFICTMN
jgi:uncharacterized membrane protein